MILKGCKVITHFLLLINRRSIYCDLIALSGLTDVGPDRLGLNDPVMINLEMHSVCSEYLFSSWETETTEGDFS